MQTDVIEPGSIEKERFSFIIQLLNRDPVDGDFAFFIDPAIKKCFELQAGDILLINMPVEFFCRNICFEHNGRQLLVQHELDFTFHGQIHDRTVRHIPAEKRPDLHGVYPVGLHGIDLDIIKKCVPVNCRVFRCIPHKKVIDRHCSDPDPFQTGTLFFIVRFLQIVDHEGGFFYIDIVKRVLIAENQIIKRNFCFET